MLAPVLIGLGSGLLIGFSVVTSIYALLQLPPSWLRALAGRFPKLSPALLALAGWNKPAKVEVRAGGALERDQIDINFPHSPVGIRRLRTILAGISCAGCSCMPDRTPRFYSCGSEGNPLGRFC